MPTFNLLPIIDSPPAPATAPHLVPFHVLTADFLKAPMTPPLLPIGNVKLEILAEFIAFNMHCQDDLLLNAPFDVYPMPTGKMSDIVLGAVKSLAFSPATVALGPGKMSEVFDHLVWFMRGRGTLGLKKYAREDVVSVCADSRSDMFADAGDLPFWGNEAFRTLRPIRSQFGLMQMGVHLVVYEGEGEDAKVWVQTRAPTVQWPGMLDSASRSSSHFGARTAGGAIEAGLTAFEALCKEAEEECGFSADIMKKYAKCTGVLPALKNGYLYNFFYELKRPALDHPDFGATEPRIVADDECDAFNLMPVPDLLQAVADNKFQPTTGPKMVHFLMRQGVITEENESQYNELKACLVKSLPVVMPHRTSEALDVEGPSPTCP